MADTILEIRNAIIKAAPIDMGDRGLLQAWLHLDYGGSGQGFGGYALYLPKSYSNHELMSVAGHFLFRCMEIASVEEWAKLPGKAIRVRASHSKVYAIGHITKDDWFCPSDDFAAAQKGGDT